MAVIAIIILTLLLLIILYILLIPISLSLRYNTEDRRTITKIKFFPFCHKFIPDKEKKEVKKIKEKPEKKVVEKKPKAGIKLKFIWQIFFYEFDTIKTIIPDLLKFVVRSLKSPDRYFLKVSLKGGLGSPDLTGGLFGAIESIRPTLGKSLSIAYQPDFMADSIAGNIIAGIEIRACSLLKEVLIFIWKLPKFRLIKIYRKVKKGDKDAKQA